MALLSLNISLRFCIDFCLFVEPPSLHGISLLVFLCWSPLARCSRLFSLLMSTDGPAHQRAHSESCRARSSGIGNGVLGVPLSESARARIVQAPSWPRVSEAGLHICNSKKAPRGLLDRPRGIWEPPVWSYRCRSWLWVRRVGRQVRGGAERSLPRIVGGGRIEIGGVPAATVETRGFKVIRDWRGQWYLVDLSLIFFQSYPLPCCICSCAGEQETETQRPRQTEGKGLYIGSGDVLSFPQFPSPLTALICNHCVVWLIVHPCDPMR